MTTDLQTPHPDSNSKVPLREHIEELIEALKVYVNTKFNAFEVYVEARLTALEKATSLAAINLEKRFDSVNEFRGQLKDQAANFVTRQEHDILIKKIDDDFKLLRSFNYVIRAEYEIQIDKLEEDIKVLREANARNEGKASQNSVNVAYIIAGIGLSISVFTFFKELTLHQ